MIGSLVDIPFDNKKNVKNRTISSDQEWAQ